ncbi:MAG: hypothetical protein PV340_00900 [Wolbachia sp.]|nr:hypothetical protein [Wolbachia sp.]MDD9336146.1 hypothetical protein [Wolbachia sp.]
MLQAIHYSNLDEFNKILEENDYDNMQTVLKIEVPYRNCTGCIFTYPSAALINQPFSDNNTKAAIMDVMWKKASKDVLSTWYKAALHVSVDNKLEKRYVISHPKKHKNFVTIKEFT